MPKKSDNDASAFKNWINADVVNRMAEHLQFHYKAFPTKEFQKVIKDLGPLELKARIQLIREYLKSSLPAPYPEALNLLVKAATEPNPKTQPLTGFALWPFSDYIQTFGLDDIQLSLEAQSLLTILFTAEFSVRPFINTHPQPTYLYLKNAAQSPNLHLRRWASEGSRPRLPWGEQLKEAIQNPVRGIEILELLKYDEEEYVRKSVANHLNDISKDHPALALKLAKKWLKESPAIHKKKISWIVRHGMRTLLKQGHPEALELLGYSGKVVLKNLKVSHTKVKIGESFEFEFELRAKETTKVMVDYILHHQKANGKTSPKVFKLTTKELQPREVLKIRKKHSFKIVTTRVYYPGLHGIEIMVNGHRLAKVDFYLK